MMENIYLNNFRIYYKKLNLITYLVFDFYLLK